MNTSRLKLGITWIVLGVVMVAFGLIGDEASLILIIPGFVLLGLAVTE